MAAISYLISDRYKESRMLAADGDGRILEGLYLTENKRDEMRHKESNNGNKESI